LNKSVLLQSAGGLLGDSSVIARPDQFPLNEGAAVTATTGRTSLVVFTVLHPTLYFLARCRAL
jgi:hypothetical protein